MMKSGFLNKPPPPTLEEVVRKLTHWQQNLPPSHAALDTLVEGRTVLEVGIPTNPHLCPLVLQVAARHLPILLQPQPNAAAAAAPSKAPGVDIVALAKVRRLLCLCVLRVYRLNNEILI